MTAKQKQPPAAHGAHWPRGKRRHEDSGGDWSRIRLQITAIIDNHYRVGLRSFRAIADALGISDRSVRRHLSGEDRPSPDVQEQYAAWCKQQRAAIKSTKR
jgi:hypothetical protein